MKTTLLNTLAWIAVLLLLAGCVPTAADPNYPESNLPPPGNSPLAAMSSLNDSLQRMLGVVSQYGPESYGELRREMNNMGASTNDVVYRLQHGERPSAIRSAYANVQRDAGIVDTRIRSINADPPVRQSWNDVLANLNNATHIITGYNGNPGPIPPGNLPPAALAGDDLVANIDAYLTSIAPAQRPEALDLKANLNTMRSSADVFRNSARAGTSAAALRPRAAELLVNFNSANQIYTNLVALDRRFNSPLFAKIADATNRVQQSVR